MSENAERESGDLNDPTEKQERGEKVWEEYNYLLWYWHKKKITFISAYCAQDYLKYKPKLTKQSK